MLYLDQAVKQFIENTLITTISPLYNPIRILTLGQPF